MKKVTEQINEGSPLFKELEDKAAKLDCLLYDHSCKRESLLDKHDEQETRIRAFGDEWLKVYDQICELYLNYGTTVDDFKNDLKIVSDKAIDDATEEILNPFF